MLFRHEMKMKETDRLDGIDPNQFSSGVWVWTYVPAPIYINTQAFAICHINWKFIYINSSPPPRRHVRSSSRAHTTGADVGGG
jgi:hypothetical protein